MDSNRPAAPSSPGGTNLRVDSVQAPGQKPRRSIRDRIVGGLLLALPLLLSIWIILWLYSIVEQKMIEPLAGLLMWKLKWTTSSTELPYWFETYAAPLIAIAFALALFYVLDMLADTRMRRGVGWFLKRVPLFSLIYSPIQQVFQSLEQDPGERAPQRMVLVTFPHPGIKLPAFVTGSCRDVDTQRVVLCVYVPTTPVPTSGFFLLVPEDEVTELNWNTEQTLQAVMSGGLASPREVTFFSLKPRPNNNPAPALAPGGAPNAPQAG
jgi:uncharacterized membrane protein